MHERLGSRLATVIAGIAVVLAALLGATHDASAAERLSLGEVSTSVTRRDVDVPALLRTLATEELRALETSKAPRDARHRGAIVSVALVRMDTESSAKGSASTCARCSTCSAVERVGTRCVKPNPHRGGKHPPPE